MLLIKRKKKPVLKSNPGLMLIGLRINCQVTRNKIELKHLPRIKGIKSSALEYQDL